VKNILHDKVEAIALAFVTLVSAHSSQELLGSRVAAAAGAFSPADTQSRLQAVLDLYGGGQTAAAMIAATNPSDAASVDALRTRLVALNTAFQSYAGGLARNMATTEVALATLDISDLQSQWDQMKSAIAKIDWSAAAGIAKAIEAEVLKVKEKLTVK